MSYVWDIFRNVNDWVRFSDAKAGVVLAFAGGSAAFLSGKADVIHGIIVTHRADPWGWGLYVAFFAYGTSLVFTTVYAFRSIWPSLSSGQKRSLLYFKHICEDYRGDHDRYAKDLAALTDDGLTAELAHQICVNAGVATRKYEFVGKAIMAFAIAGAFWAATVFLILLLAGTAPATR